MIPFYHPSRSGKGSAASFWYSHNHNAILATLMKQSGWDDKANNGRGNGLFQDQSPEMKVNVKLGAIEVAGIIAAIEGKKEWKGNHDFGEKPKSLFFTPHADEGGTLLGYNFSVTVFDKQDKSKKDSFFIRFRLDEARLIREILLHHLHKFIENSNKRRFNSSTDEGTEEVSEAPAANDSDTAAPTDDPLDL